MKRGGIGRLLTGAGWAVIGVASSGEVNSRIADLIFTIRSEKGTSVMVGIWAASSKD